MVPKKILRTIGTGSFADSITYALHGNDNTPWRGEVIAMQGVPTIESAASAMRITARTSRCEDPVVHLMLSFGPENTGHDDPRVMRDAIRTTLKSLKMDGHQYLAVVHRDTEHTHLHVIANRVRAGKAASMAWDVARLHRAALAINQKYRWPLVVSCHTASGVKAAVANDPTRKIAPSRTPAERRAAESAKWRKPDLPWADRLQDAIHDQLNGSADIEAFAKRLAKIGILLKRQRQGVVFCDANAPDDRSKGCKGSEIGLSLAKLETYFRGTILDLPERPASAMPVKSPAVTQDAVWVDPEYQARLEARRAAHKAFMSEKKALRDHWLSPEREMKPRIRRLKRRPEDEDAQKLLGFISEIAAAWRMIYERAVAILRARHMREMKAMPLLKRKRPVVEQKPERVLRPRKGKGRSR